MASKIKHDDHIQMEEEQDNKRQRTADEWQWHILLTRGRVALQANNDQDGFVSVDDEHAPKESLGWNVTIVRMKSSEHDDGDFSNDECPWLLKEPKDEHTNSNSASFFAYNRLDEDALKANKQPVKDLLPVLTKWPLGTYSFLMSRLRILLHWKELLCNVGDPINLLKQALNTLCNANASFADDELCKKAGEKHLMGDLSDSYGHSAEVLLAARREMPSAIFVHVPSDVLALQEQEIHDTVRNAIPAVKHVHVMGPCTQSSSSLMERIFWTLDFHYHVELRWSLHYNCQRSSPHARDRGRLHHETEDFWGCGVSLKSMNDNERKNLLQPYQAVTKLVAARPWSRWRSFELLKVTVLDIANKEINTKWIMFSSEKCHEAWSLTGSPYGYMQVMNSLSDRSYIFGRSSFLFSSGLNAFAEEVPPDRLFVSSDSLYEVHYDSILLMEQLFGEALVPEQLLPPGVIPVMDAETGKIPGHFGCTQPTKSRSFTDEEMDWVRICVPPITKFVTEERDSCDENGGEWCKTYNVAEAENASTHNRVSKESPYSQASKVTITYNMGVENGGIWDREQKWQWFS